MLIILLIQLVGAEIFGFILDQNEQRCLRDKLTRGTVLALQVIGNSTEFEFKILQGKDDAITLETHKNEILVRYTLSIWQDEYMQFCFFVYGKKNVKFDLSYKKGVEVNDQKLLANRGNLEGMNEILDKLENQVNNLKDQSRFQNEILKQQNNMNMDQIFGIISLTFMGLLMICTYMIVKYIRIILMKQKML